MFSRAWQLQKCEKKTASFPLGGSHKPRAPHFRKNDGGGRELKDIWDSKSINGAPIPNPSRGAWELLRGVFKSPAQLEGVLRKIKRKKSCNFCLATA